ncbi:MAG TPA: glycosyltransferase family 2 protein [Bacteroidia bacterium]|nr:glycosyltransferase family 2 protein [Bacteroidia bacterium]
MSEPLISVIVPAYNSGPAIRPCLDSVFGQTLQNVEVIVVDGQSSDETVDILRAYEKEKKLRWKSEKDDGIYDAINKGIRMAKGRWMYVLGSDDRLYENTTLEKVAPFLEKAGSGVVYGNVKIKGDAGWAKDGEVHDGEFTTEKLLRANICQQSVFYHRDVFEKFGYFNPEYKVCADWDFILRCAAGTSLVYMDVIVAEFSGGGTSAVRKEEKFYEELPANLYRYFGLRVFRKEFRPAGWRFRKLSSEYAAKGKKWKSFFFGRVARRLGS